MASTERPADLAGIPLGRIVVGQVDDHQLRLLRQQAEAAGRFELLVAHFGGVKMLSGFEPRGQRASAANSPSKFRVPPCGASS